ncbi:hypothetical protein Pogu_0607 [Pyrobaculum oguniense TE7]|uniref:Uncharacterized protein n=1 Tax=Pyrobaculum oguniense (strain DSM 13380 / JCM 10595 / TE7) TaxID=698757 RepID=H6Q7X7_PYROT|nr:hypothetical protein Pogu_0607 [Pyrobaculum oguniense TE7]
MAVERLVYVGREPALGYVYVKLYQGLIKSAYIYLKRGRRMEYFAVLTARVAKTFSGEVRRRLMQFAADRVERAVKAFLKEVEMEASSLAVRLDRLFYSLRRLYQKTERFVWEVEDGKVVRDFLEKVKPYIDVDAMWREAALRHGLGLSLDKALRYAYWS